MRLLDYHWRVLGSVITSYTANLLLKQGLWQTKLPASAVSQLPTWQARPQDMVVIAAAESLHETNHRNAALLRSQKEA